MEYLMMTTLLVATPLLLLIVCEVRPHPALRPPRTSFRPLVRACLLVSYAVNSHGTGWPRFSRLLHYP